MKTLSIEDRDHSCQNPPRDDIEECTTDNSQATGDKEIAIEHVELNIPSEAKVAEMADLELKLTKDKTYYDLNRSQTDSSIMTNDKDPGRSLYNNLKMKLARKSNDVPLIPHKT